MTKRSKQRRVTKLWGTRGILRKQIGFQRRADGRRMPAVFYFGSDQAAADAEASAIKAVWRTLKAHGHQWWPVGQPNRQEIRQAIGLAPLHPGHSTKSIHSDQAQSQSSSQRSGPPRSPAELVAPTALTVEQAAKIYLGEMLKSGKRDRWLRDIKGRLSRAIDVLGRSKRLDEINRQALLEFTDHWRRRPQAQKRDGSSMQRAVSAVYAKHVVNVAKSLLTWAAQHDQIGWEPPSRMDAILRIETESPTTAEEFSAFTERAWSEHDDRHFTIEELTRLFAAADDRTRCFMLLGLNCGYYAEDISDLENQHIHIEGTDVYLRNVRKKTNVKRQHLLWPETVAAIKQTRDNDTAKGYTFSTPDGGRICRNGYNSITKLWEKVRSGAHLPDAKFRHLRHTSANEIKKLSREEISLIHKAQTPRERIDAVYTAPNWAQHTAAVRQLHEVFRPAWANANATP